MVAALGVLVLALGLLAFFSLTGWGLLRLAAPTLPGDVTVSLAPVTGVAAFAALAAFVVTRLPIGIALGVATGAPLLVAAVVVRRRRRSLCAPLPLAAVALVAVLAASLPSFFHGGGTPATWGNADPYLWVSQAKSLISGPPPAPSTRFPDRVAYEELADNGWAPGIPALTALAAVVTRQDPVDVFGAVAALLYALTPLATYAIGRLALAWSTRLSVAAAAVVALSPYRLFSSYYGWQPQVAGVGCLLAALVLFRVGFAGSRGLTLPAALLGAGALAIYRMPFLPYVVFAAALVVGGFVVMNRHDCARALRSVARQTCLLLAATLVLAAPSVAAFIGHADRFWSGGHEAAAFTHYVRGLPSDALGLAPRPPGLTRQLPGAVTVFALALALVLLASGVRALRRRETGQRDFVLALCVGSLAALAVAQLPVFSPYLSIKLDGYGTVPMILTALAPLEGRRLPPRRLVAGGVFALLSLALVVFAGRFTLSAAPSSAAARAVAHVPSALVRINARNTWRQMWALYFTRDHPAVVSHPSAYLTSMGLDRRPCAFEGAVCRADSARRSPQNIEGRP
jgi:hypothetical protein